MDYSNRFADSLAEDFNPGVEVRDVVKEDMILEIGRASCRERV